jgi:hypothetical protein
LLLSRLRLLGGVVFEVAVMVVPLPVLADVRADDRHASGQRHPRDALARLYSASVVSFIHKTINHKLEVHS